MQTATAEAIAAKLRLQRARHVEARTAVADTDTQPTTLRGGLDVQLQVHMAVDQRLQALLAQVVVMLETVGIALEA